MTPRETSQDHHSLFRPFACECLRIGGVAVTMLASIAGQANAQSASSEVAVPEVVVTTEGQKPAAEGSAESGYRITTANVGPLGKQPIKDTPMSINVVSSDQIENLQASSTSEALKYNPTIRPQLGSNLSANYFMIRGLGYSANGNAAVDGMQASVGFEPVEDKERVEVLNGASSFLYGFSGPGGVVNYVLKRPTETMINKVTAGNYGGQQAYVHGDFGGPIDNGRFGYRVNFLKVGNGTVGVDRETHERQLFSGAFDWHVMPSTVWSFEASHFDRDIKNQQAYFLVGKATVIPAAPNLRTNYGAPYNFTHDEYNRVGTSVKSQLNDVFTLRSAFRYTETENQSRNMRDSFINNNGDYNYQMQIKSTSQSITAQGYAFIDAAFDTGFIHHDATFGYAQNRVDSRTAYPNTDTSTYKLSTSIIGNILNPSFPADPCPADPKACANLGDNLRTTGTTDYRSALLADKVKLNEQWSAFVGVNAPRIETSSWNSNTGVLTGQYAAERVTPAAALMFKPIPAITTYVAYTESLQKGEVVSDGSNMGQVLPPYVATQFEAGAKTTIGKVDINVAVFEIEKANLYKDPTTLAYSHDGLQRHRGAELTFTGKATDQLTLGGGFTWLDAKIIKATDSSLVDKAPLGVPHYIATLFGEYALTSVPGLVLLGGASYTSKEWVNNANTISIPEVFLLDAGVRYQTKIREMPTTFRVNVANLLDKRYWTNKGDDMLYTGTPRTVAFSMTMSF